MSSIIYVNNHTIMSHPFVSVTFKGAMRMLEKVERCCLDAVGTVFDGSFWRVWCWFYGATGRADAGTRHGEEKQGAACE